MSNQNNITKLVKKKIIVDKLGGKCKLCPESSLICMEFHHIDPNEKDFAFRDIKRKKLDEIEKEILPKCVCLCGRCHALIHSGSNENAKKKKNKKFILEYINIVKCQKCEWQGDYVGLEFHHRDPTDKKYNISKINKRIDNENILEFIDEIRKCDILCRNCHNKTHNESGFLLVESKIVELSRKHESYNTLNHMEIKEKYKQSFTITELAKIYNTSKSSIYYIINK